MCREKRPRRTKNRRPATVRIGGKEVSLPLAVEVESGDQISEYQLARGRSGAGVLLKKLTTTRVRRPGDLDS